MILSSPGCFVGEPIFIPRTPMSLEKEFSRAASKKVAAKHATDNGTSAASTSLAEDDG